ncbi:MAG: methyltransferase domain-containing protein, partial [Haliea sp.]
MHDPAITDKLDAAWGDPASWVANGLQWTHLEEIQALINRRVSGDPATSPMAWFAGHVQAAGALPLRRALVLGCGAGRIERALHEQGWVREIVAFDLSPKALDTAREAAAGIDSIQYVLASMDELPVGVPPFLAGSFDAVFGVASVHHCARLDNLYTAVSRLLAPGGWFFLDEYTGPDQFQYTAAQLGQLTALADLLPDRLLTTLSGQVRRGFRAPTVAEVVAVDPSEAVCSSSILPLLQEHFDIVAQRPYGG